jgi:hypothetical protein
MSPNLLIYSEYEVTIVGISTGPLTVGPIIAAPTVIGRWFTNDVSFSLANTPGDINAFVAIILIKFCFVYKYSKISQN